MKVKFKGTLVNESGAALKSITLRGCTYDKRGRLTPTALGKTTANGSFSLTSTKEVPDTPLPRLAIQLRQNNKWLMLSDQPLTFTGTIANFSKIFFHTKLIYKVGSVAFHGDNHTIPATTPVVIRRLDQPITLAGTATTSTVVTANLGSINTLNLKVANLEKEKVNLTSELNTSKSQLQTKTNQLRAKDQEILQIRTSLSREHQLAITAREATITNLQNLNKELQKATPERVRIDDMAYSMGSQIEDAQRRLNSDNSSLRLSKVSLQVKGIADPTGTAMTLPPTKDIASLAAGMSILNLDFLPRLTPQASSIPADDTSSPEIVAVYSGLTEASASRQLKEAGIAFRIYHQPLKDDDTSNLGRVIHQSPTEGALLLPDTFIKLIVGKSRV